MRIALSFFLSLSLSLSSLSPSRSYPSCPPHPILPFPHSPIPHLFPPLPPAGLDADEQLMVFVNLLGVVTFLSIVFYHFVTAKESDAAM